MLSVKVKISCHVTSHHFCVCDREHTLHWSVYLFFLLPPLLSPLIARLCSTTHHSATTSQSPLPCIQSRTISNPSPLFTVWVVALWRGGEYVEGVKKQHGGGGRKMEVNKGERTAGTKQVFFYTSWQLLRFVWVLLVCGPLVCLFWNHCGCARRTKNYKSLLLRHAKIRNPCRRTCAVLRAC